MTKKEQERHIKQALMEIETACRDAKEAAAKAIETGEEVELKPMNAFERKVVHDAVAEAGASSVSKGEDPKRRIVVLPV
jgi:spoIIIJ-associated protein